MVNLLVIVEIEIGKRGSKYDDIARDSSLRLRCFLYAPLFRLYDKSDEHPKIHCYLEHNLSLPESQLKVSFHTLQHLILLSNIGVFVIPLVIAPPQRLQI